MKRRPLARVLILATGLLVGLLAAGSPQVLAHALLVRSVPEANSQLSQPPPNIELWFSEPLEARFSGARLLDTRGEEIPTGAPTLDPSDPTHLTVPLGQLPPGIYTIAWQTLSQVDGHEWFGSFPFTVLNPDGSGPAGGAVAREGVPRSDLPTPAEVLARWLALMGGLVLFGSALFRRLVVTGIVQDGETPLQAFAGKLVISAIWPAVMAIILGSWLQVAIQAGQLGNLSLLPELLQGTRTGVLLLARQVVALAGLFAVLGLPQPRPWQGRERRLFFAVLGYTVVLSILLGLATVQGQRLLIVVSIAVAALSIALSGRKSWEIIPGLGALVLFSFSINAHAGAVPGSIWATLSDYLHLLAAAAWTGGLVLLPGLVWHVRRSKVAADRAQLVWLLRRYSYLAQVAVFILAITGLINGLVEVPDFSSLFDTAYGRVLLLKLALIVIALEIALFNNRLVHRRPEILKRKPGLERFNRQVALESILGLAIMVSVAVLVQTPAPRSLAGPSQAFQPILAFNALARADDLYVHVQTTPNQVGNNRFWVHLYHPDNSPIGEVQLVRLFFNYREQELGRATVDLAPLGRDTFGVEGAYLNQAGQWDLAVYVRRRGLDDALTGVELDVPPPPSENGGPNRWQNPTPSLPANLLIAGLLLATGAAPLLWRRALQSQLGLRYPMLAFCSGVLIVLGLVISAGTLPDLIQRRSSPPGSSIPVAIPPSPDSVAIGAALYQQACAECHGASGLGDGPAAARLEPPPASFFIHVPLHEDRELYGFVSQGFPGTAMPAYGETLSSEQIWHLVNFMRDEFGSGF
jgi:copper transport protein